MNEKMDSTAMNDDDTMNGNSSSNGSSSSSGCGDNNNNNNSKSSITSPIKDNNIGVKRQLDNEKSPNGNTISSSGRERKPVVPYAPEPQRTPSAKRQKSSIEAKAKKEEEKKAAAAKLKADAKIKAAEEKLKAPKFPIKDQEIDSYDSKQGKKNRPKIPEPKIKINSSFSDDIFGVWGFLNTFKTQLSLPGIEIDDFIEMMEYTGKESVALTEVFLAPLRIILLDNAYVAKVSAALPKGLSFCRKPDSQKEIYIQENLNQKLPIFSIKSIVNKDDGSVDKLVSEGFDSAFNGLRLLPRKLSASLICDPLMWQTVLRAILLRDPNVRELRNDIFKLFVEYDSIKRAVSGSKKKQPKDEEGGVEELENCVSDLNKYAALPIDFREEKKNKSNVLNHDLFLRLNSDPFSVLEHLIAAAQALETKELHELSFRHKISILKVLCDACFETEEIRELLAKNIEERASLITANRKRLEEKKKEQREIANCKRDDAIKLCWQANKLAADAKAVKSKKKPAAEAPTAASPSKKSVSPKKSGGSKNKNVTELPNKKDPLYPKQDQLNAMIEELALLDSLNIDKVIDNIEVEDVSDGDDDDDLARLEFTDDGPKQKSRASIRSKAGEKKTARQEKKARNFNIENANVAINRALETHGEKDIKTAIKLAQKAGFEGEDDDGNVFCTQLLKQIFKLRHELEMKADEEAEIMKQEKGMAGLVCRSEPIGRDRHFNEYWQFEGDLRLFVRLKVPSGAEKDKLATLATSVTAAANKDLQKMYSKRPFEKPYQWGIVTAQADMWEIYQSLDERGERESALKVALKARFHLAPPPAEFLKTGSEYIGRSVSRSFPGTKKKITIGKIVGWLPPLDDDPALWHVLHPDGDEEDLEEHEILSSLITDEEAARSSSSAMFISSAPIKIDSKTDKNAPPPINNEVNVPALVKTFRNSASRNHQKVKDAQLGLGGLKFEIIKAHNILADSLKNTKQWVRSVQEAVTLKELRGLLKELELMVYGLQQGVPDVDDDEEEEREKNKDREEMKKTGWDFENDAYINKRIRRFFPGQPKSDGTIIAYLSADKNDGEKWWRCVYDDNDEEDLAEDTVILGIRHFEENAYEDDTIVPDDNMDEDDDSENEALPIENLDDGDDEVYHPQELVDKITGKSNHLWPTKGVRKRWIDAVDKSNTIGEVALSLSSLLEYSKEFCDCKIDQCEGTQRPTTSIYGTNRMIGTNKSTKKRKANDDDFHDNGRQQRAAAKRVINYAE